MEKKYDSYKSVYCPALEKDVLITDWGWKHLVVAKKRTGIEKLERLELIPLVPKLLKLTTTIQGKRFQDNHDTYEFIALIGGIKIIVLVTLFKRKYYFYSVFKR